MRATRHLGLVSLIVLITLVLFTSVIFLFIIPDTRRHVMEGKEEVARDLTDTAWSILASYAGQVRMGLMDRTEAEARAISRLRTLRYGDDHKGFYWLADRKHYLIMHPFRNDLVGTRFDSWPTRGGPEFIRKALALAKASGSGYVMHQGLWAQLGEPDQHTISYVRAFKPWNWIVGTDIPLEEVEAGLWVMTRYIMIMLAGIVLVVLVLAIFMASREVRHEEQLRIDRDIIRDHEALLSAVIESAGDAIFTLSLDRIIGSANQAFGEMFGVDPDEVVGRSVALIHRDENSYKNFGEHIYPILAKEGFWNGRWDFARQDGSIIPCLVSINSLLDSAGDRIGYVAVVSDMSDHLKAEEERMKRAKLEGVLHMAAGAAHELSQPMQAIMAEVDFLTGDEEPDPQDKVESSRDLKAAVNRVRNVIGQIQSVTDPEYETYVDGTQMVCLGKSSSGPEGQD